MIQKYESAYYCYILSYGCETEHYMMYKGVRSRHATKEIVIALCEQINATHNLPNVTL